MIEAEYDKEKVDWWSSIPFIAAHIGAVVGVILVGWSPWLIALAVLSYYVRMWAITAGFHRYFSHRAFKTSRAFQFFMAFLGTLSVQKGVLWWAAHHRDHHRHSDHEPDIHSPIMRDVLWAHMGWILCRKFNATKYDKIKDFTKFPELVWLNRFHLVPPLVMGALIWWLFGAAVFVWVGLVGTVALWHGTFTINSLSHLIGRRRYATKDNSRNSLVLALITLGEGWHNNHHYYPGASRQGFYWWEIDISYYSLKLLEVFGIVWDVRGVPDRVLAKGRQRLASAGDGAPSAEASLAAPAQPLDTAPQSTTAAASVEATAGG